MKPEGRVVTAGPWIPPSGPLRLMAPLLRAVFRRFAVSSQDTDRPWRLLGERLPGWQVATHGPMYLAWGDTPGWMGRGRPGDTVTRTPGREAAKRRSNGEHGVW